MKPVRLFALGLIAATASACSKDMSDLDNYIAEVKSRKSTQVEPIPQMKPYEPFAYGQEDNRNPFLPLDSESDERAVPEIANSGLRPDFMRNKEPLEEFPLGGLRMQGTLDIKDQKYALVNSPDGVVHRVTTGDHLGQNYGKIIAISDVEIRLEEIVPDGFGGYVKRPAEVALSEDIARKGSRKR